MRGGATPGRQWIHASTIVTLESKATLGLATPNKAMATNKTAPTGEEIALGLRSWDLILGGRGGGLSPSHKFIQIDATVVMAVVFEYSNSKK